MSVAEIMVIGGVRIVDGTGQHGEVEGGGEAYGHEGQAADHVDQQKGGKGGHSRSGGSVGSAAAIGDTQRRWTDSCSRWGGRACRAPAYDFRPLASAPDFSAASTETAR